MVTVMLEVQTLSGSICGNENLVRLCAEDVVDGQAFCFTILSVQGQWWRKFSSPQSLNQSLLAILVLRVEKDIGPWLMHTNRSNLPDHLIHFGITGTCSFNDPFEIQKGIGGKTGLLRG